MNCNKNIIVFNNIKFYRHPVYESYFASKKGQIYSEKNKIILKQYKSTIHGYLYFCVYKEKVGKHYSVSKFIYECFYGEIPEDKKVGYIDDNRNNNSLSNLHLVSIKENGGNLKFRSVISFNIETRNEKNLKV